MRDSPAANPAGPSAYRAEPDYSGPTSSLALGPWAQVERRLALLYGEEEAARMRAEEEKYISHSYDPE